MPARPWVEAGWARAKVWHRSRRRGCCRCLRTARRSCAATRSSSSRARAPCMRVAARCACGGAGGCSTRAARCAATSEALRAARVCGTEAKHATKRAYACCPACVSGAGGGPWWRGRARMASACGCEHVHAPASERVLKELNPIAEPARALMWGFCRVQTALRAAGARACVAQRMASVHIGR
jgi:hypothetical protein